MNVAMIAMYSSLLLKQLNNSYFIGRTRQAVTVTKDFDTYEVNKVLYFLYLNNTKGAVDASTGQNNLMVTDIHLFCSLKD